MKKNNQIVQNTKQLPAVISQDLSATASLENFIRLANQHPILTPDEEKELTERYYYHQDLQAARQLILSHMRFVIHIARGYLGYGLPLADLIQEGNIGLMKAVKRFDPSVGVRLVSFAVHWIKAEIHEYVLRNWRIVKVATTKSQRKLFFNLRKSKQSLNTLNETEIKQIATDLNVSEKDVKEMEKRMQNQDTAFDFANDEEGFAPVLYLEDQNSDVEKKVVEEEYSSQATEQLAFALAHLDERSQDIIKSRWLDEPKSTLSDLAQKYKVSAERIRQLEADALKKIKDLLNL